MTPLSASRARLGVEWTPVLLLAVTIPLALWVAAPLRDAGPTLEETPAGSGPGIVVFALAFVLLTIGMGLLVLWAVKRGAVRIVQAVFLGAVAVALTAVFARPIAGLGGFIGPDAAWFLGFALSGTLVVVAWRRPEAWVMNVLALFVAAAVAALGGTLLGLWPVVAVLVLLVIYDEVAVRRSGHMMRLARTAQRLRLPVMVQVGGGVHKAPSDRGPTRSVPVQPSEATVDPAGPTMSRPSPPVSSRAPPRSTGKRSDGLLLGLGDLVFPAMVVVAAQDLGAWPAVGAAVGAPLGFALLVPALRSGRPQPGLPALAAGTLTGLGMGWLVPWLLAN